MNVPDIITHVLLYSDEKDYSKFRLINTHFYDVLNSSIFWQYKFGYDNLPISHTCAEFIPWILEYDKISYCMKQAKRLGNILQDPICKDVWIGFNINNTIDIDNLQQEEANNYLYHLILQKVKNPSRSK